ncbi:hypothetical protein [Kordiimonas sp.]|uniref:hypothetical protein n=1 Tax=Kordiimonas sp. TaxID=1970157 RepID=UPI003B525E63
MQMERIREAEIVHHSTDGLLIFSRSGLVTVNIDSESFQIRLPTPRVFRILSVSRIFRRLFRLDKCNVVVTDDRKNLVIIYLSNVFNYSLTERKLRKTLRLKNCRNVLHMGIAVGADGHIVFGEYGTNRSRRPVPIWGSSNGGKSWKMVHEFLENEIRHVHGVYFDKYTDTYWVPTGDGDKECYLYQFRRDFTACLKRFGDGSQVWRTVSLFFTPDELVWIMDSPDNAPRLVKMDRTTGEISCGRAFPGPVWYAKELVDGVFLVQTTKEKGSASITKSAHLYLSRDLEKWVEVAHFPHDGLPLGILKNAVIAFSTGQQNSKKVAISFEAVKAYDGKAYFLSIDDGEGVNLIQRVQKYSNPGTEVIPKPPKKINEFSDALFRSLVHQMVNMMNQENCEKEVFQAWMEKTRRFVEVYRHRLLSEAILRFGSRVTASYALQRMAFLLVYESLRTQKRIYLNAALFLQTTLKNLQGDDLANSSIYLDFEDAISLSLMKTRHGRESSYY